MALRTIKEQSSYTVVVLGDSKSGKTLLVSQHVLGRSKPTYKPTIEDCYRKLARLPDGKYKTLNVVDTSGSNEFPAMRELRIRSATAIVIVYNADSSNSTNKAATLRKEVQTVRAYDEVPIMFVGNLYVQSITKAQYQIPSGVMEDSSCEHFFMDLTDKTQCDKIFENVIQRCYQNNSWKVEVWAMSPPKSDQSKEAIKKKRGILSYISFRRKKGVKTAVQGSRSSISLPYK